MKPILDTQEESVLLRIGRFNNPNGYEINASIHLCIISGDNLQLEYLTSTSFKNKNMKCRICVSDNCHAIDPDLAIGAFRDDLEMQAIGKNYEDALLEQCQRTDKRTVENKQRYEEGDSVGIKPGYNKLIDLFNFQYDNKISGFFQSLVPDYLHTVVKGIIESAISWTICCLKAVAKLSPALYSDNLGIIDRRIKKFPIMQSLAIFPSRLYRWSKGISQLFKSHKNGADATGFFASGSIEAWKLPHLLFHLIFCLNEQVCPFKTWNPTTSKTLKHKWNIGRVIVNSLVSVMELHFCCRMKVLTQSAIENKLTDLIRNARAHMSLFRLLKQDLITDIAELSEGVVDGGIKNHLLAHMPYYKKNFSTDHRITDTELSEKKHKELKRDFEKCNKQFGRFNKDMLKIHRAKVHTKYRAMSVILEQSEPEPSESLHFSVGTKLGAPDELVFHDAKVMVQGELGKHTTSSNGINQVLMTFDTAMRIAEHEQDMEFKNCWERFKTNDMTCKLAKTVQCRQHKDTKSPDHDYTIHCNCNYLHKKANKAKNICDFIEVKYDSEENGKLKYAFAHLISIFVFNANNATQDGSEKIFLLICWMNKTTRKKSLLPYSAYEYELKRNTLYSNIVSIEALYRPAFLVSHSDKSELRWGEIKFKDVNKLKLEIFYCIPYEVVIRDYCHGDDFKEFGSSSSSSSSSNSNSSSSSSSSSNINFDEYPLILTLTQQAQITHMMAADVVETDVVEYDSELDDA